MADRNTAQPKKSGNIMNANTERPLSVYDNLTASQFPMSTMLAAADDPKSRSISRRDPVVYAYDDNAFMFDDVVSAQSNGRQQPRRMEPQHASNYNSNRGLTTPESQPSSQYQQQQQQQQQQHYQPQTSPLNDVGRLIGAPDAYSAAVSPLSSPSSSSGGGGGGGGNQLQHRLNNSSSSGLAATPAKPSAQYENVVETIKLRNSFRTASQKPVISDAKSTFFGLAASTPSSPQSSFSSSHLQQPSPTSHVVASAPPNNHRPIPATMDNHHLHQPLLYDGSSSSDRSPLLITAAIPAPQQPGKSNGEYQNIPSNSAYFQRTNGLNGQVSTDLAMAGPSASWGDPVVDDGLAESGRSASPANRSSGADQLDGRPAAGDPTNKYFMDENNQHPSQAVYMTTTVPQNIKGSNIAGRHTPTRTSLRHSRMIVVNKNYQAPRKPNPLQIGHPLLAKLMLIVQLIAGIMITCLAVWVLLWAPNTRTRDNPYWSGVTLIVAAILGLILIEFRRIPRQKMREHCFTFIRLNSASISLLAMVTSFGAFVFASIHLDNVTSSHTVCMPSDIFTSANAMCICMFGVANGTGEALELRTVDEGRLTAGGLEFQYRDLSCAEVRGAWKYILFAFTLLNMIAFIVSFLYLMMLCFPKRRKDRAGVAGDQPHTESSYAPVRSVL